MKESRSRDAWRLKLVWHAKGLGSALAVVVAVITLAALVSEWILDRIEIVALVGMHWVLLAHLARCILEHQCPTYFENPRVKHVMQDYGLLMVERSPWLGVGVATTVYIVQGDLERLVCAGHVINIQQNDLVQIKLSRVGAGLQSWKDIWSELEGQRADSLGRPDIP